MFFLSVSGGDVYIICVFNLKNITSAVVEDRTSGILTKCWFATIRVNSRRIVEVIFSRNIFILVSRCLFWPPNAAWSITNPMNSCTCMSVRGHRFCPCSRLWSRDENEIGKQNEFSAPENPQIDRKSGKLLNLGRSGLRSHCLRGNPNSMQFFGLSVKFYHL